MFKDKIEIDGREIGRSARPYIIAEMSANHGQSLQNAKDIIYAAKEAGADAVKIQTYTADTLTLNCKDKAFEAKGAWKGQYLYDLYETGSMPWEWLPELTAEAKKTGITLFSTPFDKSSVALLEAHATPAYKIASPEIIDLSLIREVAKNRKPIILSTGGATLAQINDAVAVIKAEGVDQLVLLKCTSEYPAPYKKINLRTMFHLADAFKCPVGLSDHTMGSEVPIASVALGAVVIEKHFILDRREQTPDSFFSATPDELRAIVIGANNVYEALGEIDYPIIPNPAQRSLIAISDVSQGERLIEGVNYRSLRPGGGIEPKYKELVEGRLAVRAIKRGEFLQWNLLGAL